MDFLNFNLNTSELIDGDFLKSSYFEDQIVEQEGSFTEKNQFISLTCGVFEICVFYNLEVCGDYEEDCGDYWTPPSCTVDVKSVDVLITEITIDEYEVELTPQIIKVFTKVILEKI